MSELGLLTSGRASCPLLVVVAVLLVSSCGVREQDDLAPGMFNGARRVAVVIGLNDYPACGPDLWLPHAEADAAAVAHLLRRHGFEVELLEGARAVTKKAVLGALAEAAARVGPGDDVLVFFAGQTDEPTDPTFTASTLMTADCDLRAPSSCISRDELRVAIDGLSNARHLLLIVDAPFGGGIGEEWIGASGEGSPAAGQSASWLARARGHHVMAAGGAGQSMRLHESLGFSAFGHSLLDALAGEADADGDGVMTVFEVFDHVARGVRRSQHPDRELTQEPWIGAVGGERAGAMVFVRPSGPRVLEAPGPMPLRFERFSATHPTPSMVVTRHPVANPEFLPPEWDATPVPPAIVWGASDGLGGSLAGQMVLVPAGRFWMGCNPENDCRCPGAGSLAVTHERFPAWLPPQTADCPAAIEAGRYVVIEKPFWIERTEVTVAAYAECVDAGACDPPGTSQDECNWRKPGRDDHPVNCVSWFDAVRYCAFVGRRLPTSAEWERAARGTDGRVYPWGSRHATMGDAVTDAATTWPVCSMSPAGDSPVGACDMAGNVEEWLLDPHPSLRPEMRQLAGGMWLFSGWYTNTAYRYLDLPSVGLATDGFRCVADMWPSESGRIHEGVAAQDDPERVVHAGPGR